MICTLKVAALDGGEPQELLVDDATAMHLYQGDVVLLDDQHYIIDNRTIVLNSVSSGEADLALFLTLVPCAPPEEVGS